MMPSFVGQTETTGDAAEQLPTAHRKAAPARKSKACTTWWFVEPVLIVYFFSEYPVDFVGQKYILEWVKEDRLRQDALRNISHQSNTTISPCDVNISESEYEFQESIQSYSSNFAVIESVISGVPVRKAVLDIDYICIDY